MEEVKIQTRHGGVWTITRMPCHLGGPANIQLLATPEAGGGVVMIPEWNGWRLNICDDSIAIPIEVLKYLLEEAEKINEAS